MFFLLIVFLAGVLTVLAPCVLPVLPIVIGGSMGGHKRNPFIITASLGLSIVLFTLLLKASTLFINVPQSAWSIISGGLIMFLGLVSLFPELWEKISSLFHIGSGSEKILSASAEKHTFVGDVLIGASLGPVFSACSPIYFFILASILPVSFGSGIVYLLDYALGLSIILLLIAILGQRVIARTAWAADTRGIFKRSLGALFLIIGLAIATGVDRKAQTYLLSHGFFDVTKVELQLLKFGENRK